MTESMNRSVYRLYLDFLETAENKRRWNIVDERARRSRTWPRAKSGTHLNAVIVIMEFSYQMGC
jgi:hypothetical protein